GTIPLLAGVEGGMRFPASRYFFRTIRFEESSPLLPWLRAHGIRIEVDVCAPRTVVAYFPVESQNGARSASEVTIWEQGVLLTALQKYWSDNMVSATLTFDRSEARDLECFVEAFEGQWKCVSLLPRSDHGYAQAPYIPLTLEEFAVESAK